MRERPVRTHEQYMHRMYELWFEYLQRSAGYEQYCKTQQGEEFEELYDNFGDVYSVEFSEWWEEHKELFELMDFTVDLIHSEQEAKGYIEDEMCRVLVLNMYAPNNELIKGFKKLLHSVRPDKPAGRPKSRDDVFAFYKIEGINMKPKLKRKVEYLEDCLYVYDHRYPVKLKPHYQLAIDLGLTVTHDDANDPVNKKSLTVASARHLDHAKKIIRNVEKGIFPRYR